MISRYNVHHLSLACQHAYIYSYRLNKCVDEIQI